MHITKVQFVLNSNTTSFSAAMIKTNFEPSSTDFYQPIATFVMKTYSILALPQNAQIIAWNTDATSFTIKDTKAFVAQVLPRHFRHRKYESFIRQLNMYSFSKLKNHQKPCFFNQFFKKDREDLLKYIHRKPEKKKRLPSDLSFQSLQKIDRLKEEDQVSVINHFNQDIKPLQIDLLNQQRQVGVSKSRVKKVAFKEEVQSEEEQNYSTLMNPSSKWLNKDESRWQKIKSFKSFKISMKLLEDGQESVHAQKCVLTEPWNHTRASCILGPFTLQNIPQ